MRTDQIQGILSCLLANKQVKFLGAYARDTLPEPTRYPSCVVANTDPARKPGEHWVAFYFVNPNYFEFFDSYGQSPLAYGFTLVTTHYNTKMIQSLDSAVCGHYCIFYLYFRSVGYPLESIAMQFHPCDFDWNDHLVVRWIKKLGCSSINRTTSSSTSCSQCCCARNKI